MKRTATLLLCAAAGSLSTAAPALADRDGDGPVRTPRVVETMHTEFTLAGSDWGQAVNRFGLLPIIGYYSLYAVLPGRSLCRVSVTVDTAAQRVYPRVGRHAVRLRPPLRPLLRFTKTGRHGAVRWWAGTSQQLDAAGAAIQKAPAALRSDHARYLMTFVSVSHATAPAADEACGAYARGTGARVVLSSLRTLKLADGPGVGEGPYVLG
jgi:hypothetical protein